MVIAIPICTFDQSTIHLTKLLSVLQGLVEYSNRLLIYANVETSDAPNHYILVPEHAKINSFIIQ